jgi:cobalt-precorrin 5A hydrolase/precorrin-3B C17-methyltransferase
VITTATDLAGLPALDRLPGFTARGDVAGVTRTWLDGVAPLVEHDGGLTGWAVPFESGNGGKVRVTDRLVTGTPGGVILHPKSLVVGAGASRQADGDALVELSRASLEAAGLAEASVGAVATADIKAREPALRQLAASFGVELVTFPADVLATVEVANPSDVVNQAVGSPSVAEAAALLAAGPGAALVAEKAKGRDSTVAVARRSRPAGHLAVVGLGPGAPARRTPEATAAVRHATVVVGYGPYIDQARDLLHPAQEIVRSPIGAEVERCRLALHEAAGGARVALVCSGDAGVYALASLVGELAPECGHPPVTVVPGVTAALAGAAVLGAPLGHDHASVSLSDLLTPWPEIKKRLDAVAIADFVVSFYNPRSMRRTTQLPEALSVLRAHRPSTTPAAVLTDIGRPGQVIVRTTLAELDPDAVGMLSLVVIGNSQTRWIGDWMVTPRGYPT